MARALEKTDPVLLRTIEDLRKASREHGAAIWRDLAERLGKSRARWSEVNLSVVARHAQKGETVAVPGVLLGTGTIPFAVTVAAYRASSAARTKVEAAGGRVLDLLELAREVPRGSNVRILG